MRFRSFFIVPALLCATAAFGQAKKQSAHADIMDAQGQKIGTAVLTQAVGGVHLDLNVSQLPPGVHGIHVHAVGKCEGPDFKTAGGHFNPDAKMHGKNNPAGPHAGDLMNIVVDEKGNSKASLATASVTLGDGPNSLFHDGGTALVIHEKEDDYKADPSGNSGGRIACGVIQK